MTKAGTFGAFFPTNAGYLVSLREESAHKRIRSFIHMQNWIVHQSATATEIALPEMATDAQERKCCKCQAQQEYNQSWDARCETKVKQSRK
mmetsp:Transcript_7792/g.14575  ORF Transcript_7792/g.14575 Transcript_7792/m.14575 type:complete len:91 (-) Transcript_7792:71-343(-)